LRIQAALVRKSFLEEMCMSTLQVSRRVGALLVMAAVTVAAPVTAAADNYQPGTGLRYTPCLHNYRRRAIAIA
jgi:hypothetical protein